MDAVREATFTGVEVICSIHGEGVSSVKKRPSAKSLIEEGIFDRYIVLDRLTPGKEGAWEVLDPSGQRSVEGERERCNGSEPSSY